MPLPDNFSEWEHLQNILLQTYNRVIRDEFNDVGDETWDEDITTPRGSLRVACTLKDSDSAIATILRMMLFYFVLGQASALQTPVYGIPIPSFQEARQFKPQIQLYFQEPEADVDLGYRPVTGNITFRLMNETSTSITHAETVSLANKIKQEFGTGTGYVWKKGKVMVSYTDRAHGYQLQLLCRSKTEGRELIQRVLSIQNHTPDWKFMNVSENEEATQRYPTVPGTQTILGKTQKKPRARPIADVRFRFAALHIWGLVNPVVLLDKDNFKGRTVIDS